MVAITQSIVLLGIFLIVFGVGPRLYERNRDGRRFLSAILSSLNKNPSEKVMRRVDSGTVRSTCQ